MKKEGFFQAFDGTCYTLRPLKKEQVEAAFSLCNEAVGENMYTREELSAAVDSPRHFFYLAELADGSIAGYMYFYLEQFEKLPAYGRLDPVRLAQAGLNNYCTAGNLQSIGVKPEHRGTGLSGYLMSFAIDMLFASGGEFLLGVCWKVGDTVPMGRIMEKLAFSYLCDVKHYWYDHLNLNCPYCGGRCRCDAAVYYRLPEEEKVE